MITKEEVKRVIRSGNKEKIRQMLSEYWKRPNRIQELYYPKKKDIVDEAKDIFSDDLPF